MRMIAGLPWWAKLGAKLVLSRLPLPYTFWRRLGLFKHGAMNDPERAIQAFRRYFERANAHHTISPGFNSLELGPGDSILAGIVARACGARHAFLVDSGAFAETDVDSCYRTAARLRADGLNPPAMDGAKSLSDTLDRCGISYLTEGTASLAAIPDASIDFCWSQAVLEHVRRGEFPTLLRELRRIMRPDAVGLHGVDFRDHLAAGLNNLRFRDEVWESSAFQRGGFYTNRIQCHVMIEMFENAGFSVQVVERTLWPRVPLPRSRMALPFREMHEDQLRVADAELLIQPRGEAAEADRRNPPR